MSFFVSFLLVLWASQRWVEVLSTVLVIRAEWCLCFVHIVYGQWKDFHKVLTNRLYTDAPVNWWWKCPCFGQNCSGSYVWQTEKTIKYVSPGHFNKVITALSMEPERRQLVWIGQNLYHTGRKFDSCVETLKSVSMAGTSCSVGKPCLVWTVPSSVSCQKSWNSRFVLLGTVESFLNWRPLWEGSFHGWTKWQYLQMRGYCQECIFLSTKEPKDD